MAERLRLTRSAQFYRKKDDFKEEFVKSILDAASAISLEDENYVLDIFRDSRNIEEVGFEYIFSARVFATERPVYFFDDEFVDTIYAFILIIEVEDYLVVFKKSCASINDVMDLHFELVEAKEITSKFDNDVEFQKLSVRNMTVSDSAMRAKAYEAANLNGLISLYGAGRSIPYFLKLRQGATLKTISGAGRITEFNPRDDLNTVASWVKNQIDFIKLPSVDNFLNSFAGKIDLNEVLSQAAPNAILIEAGSLFEHLQKDGLRLVKNKSGSKVELSEKFQTSIFSRLEKVYEINSLLEILKAGSGARIKQNKKTLNINSKILGKIYVEEKNKYETLQKFIVKHGFYSITFDDPKFMYYMGSCFEDRSNISQIDDVLDMLKPVSSMGSVKSEKGSFKTNSKNFSKNSMFYMIENLHKKDDYIFCDDLGNEWADHITFNLNKKQISFIHSKHGDLSKSASNLHDVVSQGIKNIGNMYFDLNKIQLKLNDFFSSDYNSSNGVSTRIRRARKGVSIKFNGDVEKMLKDYGLNRRCVLSCSFLSKNLLISEFGKIKLGQKVSGNIIQMLWILSSFSHSAKEMNVIPEIYCSA